MSLRELAVALRRGWLVILLAALAFGAMAAASTQLRPSLYYATSAVVVNTPPGAVWAGAANTNTVTELRRSTYAGMVKTEEVVGPVVAALGIEHSPAEFARRIVVSSSEGVGVIRISVTDTDPQLSVDAANALADRLATLVRATEIGASPDAPPGLLRAQLRMIDITYALPPGYRAGPGGLVTVGFGLLLGGFAGAWLVVFRDTVAPRVHDATDVRDVASALSTLGRVTTLPVSGGALPDHELRPKQWEQFRALAARVRVLDGRTLLITGGDRRSPGTASAAWMLANALAESGGRVAIVDARIGRFVSSATASLPPTLADVLTRHADLATAIQPSGAAGVHLIRAGSVTPKSPDPMATREATDVFETLTVEFDHVVCIAGSVLDTAAVGVLARTCDSVILTVEAGRTRERDLDHTVTSLETGGAAVAGAVLTRTRWWLRPLPGSPSRKPRRARPTGVPSGDALDAGPHRRSYSATSR